MSNANAKFQPRNDFVFLRIKMHNIHGKLHLPEQAAEAKRFYVESIGPKVENLKVGDEVLAIGQPNVDFSLVPGCNDLVLIRESHVICVVNRQDETETKI